MRVQPRHENGIVRKMNVSLRASTSCAMIQGLLRPDCYPHPAEHIEMLETHISWVFLAGAYAYKVKKPVDLGFVDFTSLERRHHFCDEELKLNRRLAPQLYLDVVEIHGSPDAPRINGPGPLLDYALRMRRFPQEALASRLLTDGRLTPALLDRLALRIAAFHEELPAATAGAPFGTCASVLQDACQNFEEIASLSRASRDSHLLARLRDWTEREFVVHYSDFRGRRASGMTRECHGDLHLRNIALIDGELVPFDCIEFNPGLRWIDVMSDVAFLFMDLLDRGADALAWRFLNTYLGEKGLYSSLTVLRFYLVYRATVRAKVHLMRARQAHVSHEESVRLMRLYRTYLELALRCTSLGRPAIVLMHGLSGSGKSTIALSLAQELGGVRIRSDLERKRLARLTWSAQTGSPIAGGLYGQDATQATYSRLTDAARAVVAAGHTAIVDAAFLMRAQRRALVELAARIRVPIVLVDVRAPRQLLRSRILSRAEAGTDPSEASLEVLEHQIATADPVLASENLPVIRVDGRKPLEPAALTAISSRIFAGRTVAEVRAISTA